MIGENDIRRMLLSFSVKSFFGHYLLLAKIQPALAQLMFDEQKIRSHILQK